MTKNSAVLRCMGNLIPSRGSSRDTPKFGVFSISPIKELTKEREGNNCRILLKYKINNAKGTRTVLHIVQINSFVTYLTSVIFKKVTVVVMSSSNTKDTLKKIYPKTAASNTCRLCRSIYATKYLKNFYSKANFQLLVMAKRYMVARSPVLTDFLA